MSHPIRYLGTLLCAALLAACAPGAPAATGQPTPADLPPTAVPLPPTQPAGGDTVVARVNGQPITLTAYQRELARRRLVMGGGDPALLEAETLDQLIEQQLILQGAAAENITVSEAAVQAELAASIELAGGQAAWDAWLAANLYTPEEFVEALRGTLVTNAVRDALTSDLDGPVPQVHARHILVRTEAEAQSVLASLQSGGDFAQLAQQLSLDETTRAQGGDLGWFAREELLAPELAGLAFSLAAGQIGGPVGTALGYHIVQTLEADSRPVEPERLAYIAQVRLENWLRQQWAKALVERLS